MINLKKDEKIILERVALEMIKNNIEPTSDNMVKILKTILKRDRHNVKYEIKKISKILTPTVWGRIQKKEIDKKVINSI